MRKGGCQMTIQKNVLILVGILILSYVIIFLLSPKDITDYTIADTEYWRETENRLLLRTVYDYNDKYSLESFPETIGEWKGSDYRYPEYVYKKLNADILMSRKYMKNNKSIVWMDIINSHTRESFHKQKICVQGAGWSVDNESISEFNIINSVTKLHVNRLDISKKNKKQVMVYWFMFKKFGDQDSITMIRLSSPVYNNNTEKTYNSLKDFVEKQLSNETYNDKKEEITIAQYLVNRYGNKGKIGIMLSVMIPFGITLVGIMKKRE